MNLKQALYEIDIYGFTLVQDALSSAEVTDLRAALIRCEQAHWIHSSTHWSITQKFCLYSKQFSAKH